MERRIALTGGIACGKSLVAQYLRQMGIETIDADDIVHEFLPDAEERKRIAAEVFADPQKRRELEGRLHPLVKSRIDAFLSEQSEKIRLAVVPLLFETHWDREYDIICTVATAREVQIARMEQTRGYSRIEAEARLAAQMPVAEKAERSQYVINNDSTPEALASEVQKFVTWLKKTIHTTTSFTSAPAIGRPSPMARRFAVPTARNR